MFKLSRSAHQVIILFAIVMVLTAEIMSPDFAALRRNHSRRPHDHEKIIFDGPNEEIVLRLNFKLDKTLQHIKVEEIQS
jgi:hypothetical protein